MGRMNPPDEAGKYTTTVNLAVRQLVTAKGETLTLADISSNCPILLSSEDNYTEMWWVYSLSIAVHPHQPVYLDTGDVSLTLIHCGDSVGVFIATTPLTFHVKPDASVFCLEYHSSFYAFVYLDQPIRIETEEFQP